MCEEEVIGLNPSRREAHSGFSREKCQDLLFFHGWLTGGGLPELIFFAIFLGLDL
jgi:hypothetical protein